MNNIQLPATQIFGGGIWGSWPLFEPVSQWSEAALEQGHLSYAVQYITGPECEVSKGDSNCHLSLKTKATFSCLISDCAYTSPLNIFVI